MIHSFLRRIWMISLAICHFPVDDSFSIIYTNISVLAGQDLPLDLGQNGYLILNKRISKHISSR